MTLHLKHFSVGRLLNTFLHILIFEICSMNRVVNVIQLDLSLLKGVV